MNSAGRANRVVAFGNRFSKSGILFELDQAERNISGMDSKTLTTVLIVIICALCLPMIIGLIGGVFGVFGSLVGGIFGIIGGLFGAIFGFIGALFGAVFGFFAWIFGAPFNWHWGEGNFFDHGDIINLFVVIMIVVLLTRAKAARSRK